MAYSITNFNEQTFPAIRGSWLLCQISKSKEDASKLCDVVFIAGHWATLTNQRRLLCVFDACPSTLQIPEIEQKKTYKSITNNQEELNSKPDAVGEGLFLLNLPNKNLFFTKIFFNQTESYTRLFAIVNDGRVFCWRWFRGVERDIYKWKLIGTAELTEGLSVIICDIFYSANGTMVWWETDSTPSNHKVQTQQMLRKIGNKKRQLNHRLRYRMIKFEDKDEIVVKKTGEKDRIVTETMNMENTQEGGIIIDGFDLIKNFIGTEKGVWILTNDSIGFWGYGSGSVKLLSTQSDLRENYMLEDQIIFDDQTHTDAHSTSFEVLKSSELQMLNNQAISNTKKITRKKAIPNKALFIVEHQNTHDILLIEPNGRILISSYTHSSQGVVAYLLCNLQLPSNLSMSQLSIILPIHHILLAFFEDCFCVFDIKSGILLDLQYLPNKSVWKFKKRTPATSTQFGISVNQKYPIYQQQQQQQLASDLYSSDIWYSNHDYGFWKPAEGIWQIIPPSVFDQISSLSSKIPEETIRENRLTVLGVNPGTQLKKDKENPDKKTHAEENGKNHSGENSHLFPVNYLANISKHWNLDRYHAKFTFEELINYSRNLLEIDEHALTETELTQYKSNLHQVQLQLSKELLNHLQNPGLILLLLRDKSHKKFLNETVENFVKTFKGDPSLPMNSRIAARNLYHFHTLLNSNLINLFEQYNQLSLQQKQFTFKNPNEGQKAFTDQDFINENLTSGEKLLAVGRAKIEMLAYRYPKQVLDLLENYLGLSEIWRNFDFKDAPFYECIFKFPSLLPAKNLLLTQQEESITDFSSTGKRSKEHPLFTILCRLYYRLNPKFLIPFVLLVQQSYQEAIQSQQQMPRQSRSFIDRAISAMPPIIRSTPVDGEFHQSQTSVLVTMLCLGGQGQRAIQFLLERDMWEQIFDLMRQYQFIKENVSQKFNTQSEIFHILLTWCIRKNDIEHIQSLWDFTPKKFGIFNLLRTIQLNQTIKPQPTANEPIPIFCDSANYLTVGTFCQQMIQMANEAKLSELL